MGVQGRNDEQSVSGIYTVIIPTHCGPSFNTMQDELADCISQTESATTLAGQISFCHSNSNVLCAACFLKMRMIPIDFYTKLHI